MIRYPSWYDIVMIEEPRGSYGSIRERAASISYAEIESAARSLMVNGGYPSVAAVRKALKRGSSTTIADSMRRFWKDQGALNSGNPVALTQLPAKFADAALALWEQALQLSQDAARHDDNAARERLKQIAAENELRAHSLNLREKDWESAARERERALADTRAHLLLLSKSLARAQATLQAREARITDLETQIAHNRQQIASLIARAVTQHRTPVRRTALRSALPRSRKRLLPQPVARRAKRIPARRKVLQQPKVASRGRSRKTSPRRKR